MKSNEDLLRGYADGRMSDFEVLFRRLEAPLHSYIRRCVHDPQLAADLAQTVWEKVIVRSAELSGRATEGAEGFQLRPYMFAIASNLIADQYRKSDALSRTREYTNEMENISTETSSISESEPMHGLIYRNLDDCIQRRLTSFSEKVKLTFEITRDSALSYQEAAVALNINVESVRSRVKQVLKKLRPCLEEFVDG